MVKKPNDSEWRFERKFVTEPWLIGHIKAWLSSHPAGFSEIYHTRTVNNIYLDSPTNRFFWENIDGLAERKKVRLRWYGPLYQCIEPTLEFKLKRGVVGAKESYKGAKLDITPHLRNEDLHRYFKTCDFPAHVKETLKSLEMRLINRYQRQYYLSLDSNFRITLDTELEYFETHGSKAKQIEWEPKLIIELKYNKQHEDKATKIMQNLNVRLTKNSKYVTGFSLNH
ncbi:MAG: polyphosphate polymerase domain-containing protein [bacterium]|nr:polyphosphate polymerase domain-containing protein [bacterium]